MPHTVVVHGRYADRQFIADGNLPDTEGTAELVITPSAGPSPPVSVFELFGKAPRLRTAEDIAAQIKEERDEWGEP